VLQLGYLERLLRCHDQAAQVIFRPAGIGELGQGEPHIGVGAERGALIGGDKFPLDIFGQIFLPFESDVELLDQALINLMRNAIEALRDEPRGRITLSALNEPSGRAVISVTDNGPGIASDQREKVFVPFSTTKRQGGGGAVMSLRF
jgi:signal transduction histidine kinase